MSNTLISLYRKYVTTAASLLFVIIVAPMPLAHAIVMEQGTLNIIDDPGNASDGLGYLDLSFSTGLRLSDALVYAQADYPNARLATISEFSDLFAAAGITFGQQLCTSTSTPCSTLSAADGFTHGGPQVQIASGPFYDNGKLGSILGTNAGQSALIWTNPGTSVPSTNYDHLILAQDAIRLHTSGFHPGVNVKFFPNNFITFTTPAIGWLLVTTDPAQPRISVPAPSTLALLVLGLVGLCWRRRKAV